MPEYTCNTSILKIDWVLSNLIAIFPPPPLFFSNWDNSYLYSLSDHFSVSMWGCGYAQPLNRMILVYISLFSCMGLLTFYLCVTTVCDHIAIVNLLQPASTQCNVGPVCDLIELLSTHFNLPQPSVVLVQCVSP